MADRRLNNTKPFPLLVHAGSNKKVMSETAELEVLQSHEIVVDELTRVVTAIDAAIVKIELFPVGTFVTGVGPICEAESRWKRFVSQSKSDLAYAEFGLESLKVAQLLAKAMELLHHLSPDPPEWPRLVEVLGVFHSIRQNATDAILRIEKGHDREVICQTELRLQAVLNKLMNYQLATIVLVLLLAAGGGFGIWKWFTH